MLTVLSLKNVLLSRSSAELAAVSQTLEWKRRWLYATSRNVFIYGPAPEQRKSAIVYNLRKHSEGHGRPTEQYPSRNTDDKNNQLNETKSTRGGQRHMFTHSRQVTPSDLRLPRRCFGFQPINQSLPSFRLGLLRPTVTALLPGQRGARVVYISTYRRAWRPLRWLR